MLAAVEEERLTRVKHTKAFPSQAIQSCLDQAGLSPDDVDRVALFVDPLVQLLLAPANGDVAMAFSEKGSATPTPRCPVSVSSGGAEHA